MGNFFVSEFQTQCTAVYRFSRVCKLTVFGGAETSSSARAKFILPEINKLSAEVKSGSLAMLLVSCGMTCLIVWLYSDEYCDLSVAVVNIYEFLQLISQILKRLI